MMQKTIFGYLFFIICCVNFGCDSIKKQTSTYKLMSEELVSIAELKVLTLNTWHEGTTVKGGFNAIADIIIQSEADIVLLCEVRNYDGKIFSDRIVEELHNRNVNFYSFNSEKSAIVLSKLPISAKPEINNKALTKCIVKLNDTTSLAVYAAHLDYTHYACYLPRGYDGITWEKLPEPILDVDEILKQNKASKRDEAIDLFVEDAITEKENVNLIILGGDFNEPSHLDWKEDTKDIFDHNGTVVAWHNSVTLKENNYLDAYRVKYPNPVTHPGHTWAAYNTDIAISKLVWTPEADDRDRIDFIYYNDDPRISLEDIIVVGPSGIVVKGKGIQNPNSLDKYLEPKGTWPSDHKGVLATFNIK